MNITELIKADSVLVFDLDGTIADTEKFHWMAHNEVLKEYGINLSDSDILKYIGNSDEKIYQMICEDYDVHIDIPKAIRSKVLHFIDLSERYNIQPYNEIKEYLFSKNEVKILLTAQRLEIVEVLLRSWQIRELFSDIISLSNNKKTKKEALETLGYDKTKIVMFEDTPRIIEDIRNSGYKCVAIVNNYNKNILDNDMFSISTIDKPHGICRYDHTRLRILLR